MNTPTPLEIPNPLLLFSGVTDLNAHEARELAELLRHPTFRKWLDAMIANTIKDHWEIPLLTLAQDGLLTSHLKTAFVKGQISILQTIRSYLDEKPSVQPPSKVKHT